MDGIAVVADTSTLRNQAIDRYIGDTIERQLEAADLLILNKVDLVDDETLQAVAAFTDEKWNDIYQAPNVQDPVCLKNEDGLTEAGEAFMFGMGLNEIEEEDLYPVSKEARKFNEERGMGGRDD